MTGKSKQLSGSGKDRYLDRLIQGEPDVPADAAERLAAKAKEQISSIRVRRDVVDLSPLPRKRAKRTAGTIAAPTEPEPEAPPPAPLVEPAPEPVAAAHPELQVEAQPEPSKAPTPPFDPYVFGLVPIFQREGRDGLIAKLETLSEASQLRLMAQKQQISLRAELRTGEVALSELREAIADAVEKRIADRHAAAR